MLMVVLSMVLTACAPAEAPVAPTVQPNDSSQPKITDTLTPPIFTATISPPTTTLSTVQIQSTQRMAQALTEQPPSKLRDSQLTAEDLSIRKEKYWLSSTIGQFSGGMGSVDNVGFTYERIGATGIFGDLIAWETSTVAEQSNSDRKSRDLEGIGVEIPIPDGFDLPENAWIVHMELKDANDVVFVNSLILGFSTGTVSVRFEYYVVDGYSLEEEINFLAYLGETQYHHLVNAGYL